MPQNPLASGKGGANTSNNNKNNSNADAPGDFHSMPDMREAALVREAREKTGADGRRDLEAYRRHLAATAAASGGGGGQLNTDALRAAAAANTTVGEEHNVAEFDDKMRRKREKERQKRIEQQRLYGDAKHRDADAGVTFVGVGGSGDGDGGGGDGASVVRSVHTTRTAATTRRQKKKAEAARRRGGAASTQIHVYSIPEYSYYVTAQERRAQKLRMAAHLLAADASDGDPDDASDAAEDEEEAEVLQALNDLFADRGVTPSAQVLVPLLAEEEEAATGPAQEKDYEPLKVVDESRRPPRGNGRLIEQERYTLPECPPYRIPLYDQACHKLVFESLFSPGIEFMELFYLLFNPIMLFVNIAMTVINVFFNSYDEGILEWVRVTSIVIFSIEFAVVIIITLMLLLTIIHAFATNNVGTTLAIDVATLMNYGSIFSMLLLVGFASPSYATRKIVPYFLNATRFLDYVLFVLYGALWLCICVAAFLALISKLVQADFAYSKSITEWTFPEFVQLVGLCMNLAKVDFSYMQETSVLLDAIHRHYIKPGEPRGLGQMDDPCLYSKLLRCVGMSQYQYYEYFNVIFDFHMDWHLRAEMKEEQLEELDKLYLKNPAKYEKKIIELQEEWEEHLEKNRKAHRNAPPSLPLGKRMRKCFNYLAFIFQLDNVQLRRFLQMIQSPLPFYQMSRESFMTAFLERDKTGMDLALWRSDPIAASTRSYARKAPNQFNISFICEDKRDVWDPAYYLQRDKEAAADGAKVASDAKDS